jgi:hypothetical protein
LRRFRRYRFTKLKLPVVVTDVQPGFVDTPMAKADRQFWVASPQTAARQIAAAIRGESGTCTLRGAGG